jgi:hypothetical protein
MRCFTPRLRLFGRERDVDARAGSGSYEKASAKTAATATLHSSMQENWRGPQRYY